MANKPVPKYPIDKEAFMKILKERGLTIRELGRHPEFYYSDKSIERALASGYMSHELAYAFSYFLNVPVKSFFGEIRRNITILDPENEKKWHEIKYTYENIFTNKDDTPPSIDSIRLLIEDLEELKEGLLLKGEN